MAGSSRLDLLQARLEKLQEGPQETISDAEVSERFQALLDRFIAPEDRERTVHNAHVLAALAKPTWRGDVVAIYNRAIDDLVTKLFVAAGGIYDENDTAVPPDPEAQMALARGIEEAFWTSMNTSPVVRVQVAERMAQMDDELPGEPKALFVTEDHQQDVGREVPHLQDVELDPIQHPQPAPTRPQAQAAPTSRFGGIPVWTPTVQHRGPAEGSIAALVENDPTRR